VPKAISVGPSMAMVDRINPDDASYAVASSS
jgi:hypothetical protein